MRHQKIRKAVILAAGFGTRFLPATKAMPKEMLTIVDKPVIQYLAEEAVASGIKEIIIVTRRGKQPIEDHFDMAFELEKTLEKKGKKEELELVRHATNLAKFVFVRQPEALGDGHAILCAKEVIGDDPFAVLFGDDLVDHKTPALKQLINAYEKTGKSIIALEKIDKKQSDKYGMIKPLKSTGRLHQIAKLVEKPAPEKAPSDLGIIGKYIVTPDIWKALNKATPSVGGETRLIDGFIQIAKKDKIFGYEIEGQRYDAGSKIGMIAATINFALKRKDLAPQLKKYLRSLDLK